MSQMTILDCKHDQNDPDHIICIERNKKKKASHQFVAYVQDRYDRYYHPRHRNRHLHRSIDGILVSTIVFLLGVYTVSLFGTQPESIKISLLPSSQIRGGEETTITLAYENSNDTDILDARIELMLPEHFIVKEFGGLPVSPKRNIKLNIGSVPRGTKGAFIIRGTPLDSLGKEQSFIASLVGIRKKDHTEEHVVTSIRYIIPASAIETRGEFPQAVLFQQSFTGAVYVKNTATHPIEDIRVSIVTPDGFLPSKPLPKEVSIKTLAAGAEYTIPLKGRFTYTEATELLLRVHTSLSRGNDDFLQSSISIPIAITQKTIVLSIAAEENPRGISEDGRKSYVLHWENTSDTSLSNLSLGVMVDTDTVDMSSLRVDSGVSDGNHTILWTPGNTRTLEYIAPSDSGIFHFNFKLKELHKKSISDALRLIPFASYNEQSSKTRIEINGDTAVFIRNSPLSLTAFARYYTPEGEQIGRGPLPPIAGQTTRYHIFLLPEDIIHPLKNVTITAELSPQASWAGIVPLGSEEISYNETSKSITWTSTFFTLEETESPHGTVFELGLTPKREDIGKEIPLLNNISIHAEDAITHSLIQARAEHITTKLIHDQKAPHIWTVQK